MKHENGKPCERCEQKLTEANPTLVSWFYWVKSNFPDTHIAWSFRDQASQDNAFFKGLSTLTWPNSKHNVVDENGKPCAEALDLFQLGDDGKAYFLHAFYKNVHELTEKEMLPIKWGGTFKNFPDNDHFELIRPVA